MKFGQLIECNKRNIFRQKSFKSDAGRQVLDLILILFFLISLFQYTHFSYQKTNFLLDSQFS